jgi:pimeloyl-ACP methyl ester carboxylesterase
MDRGTTGGEPDVGRSVVRSREVVLAGRGRLHLREAVGPGPAPTLVLVHGLGATAALNWDGVLPTLARRFRVLAPDVRGHGRGIRCGAGFRLTDCADDLAALLRHESGGPALVAGYSMGGPIAQLLARDHPDLVAGLILCATSRDFRGRPAERASFGALGLTALTLRLTDRLPLLSLTGRWPSRWTSRWPGTVLAETNGHQPPAVLAAAASLGTFTSRSWITELTAPAVVIATTRDRVVPIRRQHKLAAALDAPLVDLEAGHMAPFSHPRRLADALTTAVDHLLGRTTIAPDATNASGVAA